MSETKSTILSRGFINIFIANVALNTGILMVSSILPLYGDHIGSNATQIGMLVSFYTITAIVFRFVSAPIMDTYNRKYIVIFSTFVIAVAFFGFGISKSFPTLLVFRLIQGCGIAFGNSCCLAIVVDILPKDKFSSGVGYYALASVIGQAIGPAIGIFLVEHFTYQMVFFTGVGIMFVAAILAAQLRIKTARGITLKFSMNSIIAKEALLPSALSLIVGAGVSVITSFLILFARYQGVTSNVGIFFTVYALATVVTRPLVGKLTDRFGFVKIMIPAFFCGLIAFFIIRLSSSLFSFLLAAVVSALGIGACQPALQSLTMKTVKNERRGAASSTNYMGYDVGFLTGPIVAGSIIQSNGYVPMWYVFSAIMLIAALITLIFRKRIMKIESNFVSEYGG